MRLHVDRRRLAHGRRRDTHLPAREKKRLLDRFGARTATASYARNDAGHDKAKRLGRRRLRPHARRLPRLTGGHDLARCLRRTNGRTCIRASERRHDDIGPSAVGRNVNPLRRLSRNRHVGIERHAPARKQPRRHSLDGLGIRNGEPRTARPRIHRPHAADVGRRGDDGDGPCRACHSLRKLVRTAQMPRQKRDGKAPRFVNHHNPGIGCLRGDMRRDRPHGDARRAHEQKRVRRFPRERRPCAQVGLPLAEPARNGNVPARVIFTCLRAIGKRACGALRQRIPPLSERYAGNPHLAHHHR